jgi:flavin-dependent dehydrogenase
MNDKIYDNIIIGGGLAGLSLAILLAQKKYSVLVIEKKSYPYHKVCGEYISMESWDFICRLGIPLESLNLPIIRHFEMSSSNGESVQEDLDLGGFGMSRYTLDKLLADKATEIGVEIKEQTTCSKYEKNNDSYQVYTNNGIFTGQIICASFGRHAFGNFYKASKESENWIGVKYHIQYSFPVDKIALHTFKHGYCGISKVDNNSYCLCYLAKSSLLKQYGNDIKKMEEHELYKNPFLKAIFSEATFLYEKPLTISNITFDAKSPVYDNVFYLGDSAGAIAPLTGNGMSNAMRSAFLLSKELDLYFKEKLTRHQLELNYSMFWNHTFKQRIVSGKLIQYFFCNPNMTPLFIQIMSKSKWLRKFIIKQTHGEIF